MAGLNIRWPLLHRGAGFPRGMYRRSARFARQSRRSISTKQRLAHKFPPPVKANHLQGQHRLSSSSTCALWIVLPSASQLKYPTKQRGPPSATHFATRTVLHNTASDNFNYQRLLQDEPRTPLERGVPLHPWIPPGFATYRARWRLKA